MQTAHATTRVLYICSSGDFYGAERCLLNLVSHLTDSEFIPLVILPFDGLLQYELQRVSVETKIIPLGVFRVRRELYSLMLLRRMSEWIPAVAQLVRIIRREKIRLVHSNTTTVIAGAIAARIAGVPHIWHVREMTKRPKLVWSLLRRLILFLSDSVICISNAVAFNLANANPKVRVIHDGVDVEAFQQPAKVKNEIFRVGMIARINPWKGHEVFIRAAQIVMKVVPETRFTIVGGYLPQYKNRRDRLLELSKNLGLSSVLSFAGQVPPDSIPEILNSFDVLVLPSTEPEPLGQVILEAMALAKPVIATNVGGPPEIIINGKTGYLVEPSDPTQLAEAIIRLLKDDQLRLDMGRAGLIRVTQEFPLQRNVESIVKLYRELLAAHKSEAMV